MELTLDKLKKTIIKSQHCQRNWDLSKQIPDDELNIIMHAATQCPSKQNIAYYDTYFITNRDMIEKIHSHTVGFYINGEHRTNSQVLANLLVVFTERSLATVAATTEAESFHRNSQIDTLVYQKTVSPVIERDVQMAIGIAAGFVNMTSTLLGYSTGCCACFDGAKIQELLNSDRISLLMGVGFPDGNRPRREHHMDKNLVFPALKKQEIQCNVIR